MKPDPIHATHTFAKATWVSPGEMVVVEQLFDHVPETAFFVKDYLGRYAAVNQSLVERCGLKDKRELIGLQVRDVFPRELAEGYAAQDESVLRTGRPIVDHLELHWYSWRKPGWCLTTKLPLRDRSGAIVGIAGISRDLRAPGDSETIPQKLASTLEHLETHYHEPLTPGALAAKAELPRFRFARLIKRIFRLTPNQLIMQTRLAAAARLLVETDRTVADIACACGFYDHSALTRAFRSVANLTPSKFRRMIRENAGLSGDGEVQREEAR